MYFNSGLLSAPNRLQRRGLSFGNETAPKTKDALLQQLRVMLSRNDQDFKNKQAAFRERNGVDQYLDSNPQLLMDLIESNGDANMPFYKSATRMRLIEGIITEAEADKITLAQLSNLVQALTFDNEEVNPFRLSGLLDRYLVANGHEAQCYI